MNTGRQTIDLGLERIAALLKALGNPHLLLNYVHIAGTNGKGSVCAFVSTVLHAAGYKVGRFTSPYTIEPRDSVTVDLVPISLEKWDNLNKRIVEVDHQEKISATTFEILTTLAFIYFYEEKVDFAVVEVGLGGSLDSTNVIPTSLVSVITSISFDHMNMLGNSLQSIARHKAGILKTGGTVVIAPQPPEVLQVINNIANERKCTVIQTTPSTYHNTKEGHAVAHNGFCYPLGLQGNIQLENSAIALGVFEVIRRNFKISDQDIINGLGSTKWPGRNEWKVHPKCGTVLLDGAHNDGSSTQLRSYVDSVLKRKQKRHVLWIFGATKGKDLQKILTNLLREGDEIFAVPFSTPEQMGWIQCCGLDDIISTSISLLPNLIVITGSLYLLRDALNCDFWK